jgi:hypothetical protein
LDLLWKNGISHYRIMAVDPHEQRRKNIKAIYLRLLETKTSIHPESTFDIVDVETARKESAFSADGIGFDGVIEVRSNLHYSGFGTLLVSPDTGGGDLFRGFTRLRSRASIRCHNIRRSAPRLLSPDVWSSVIRKECLA